MSASIAFLRRPAIAMAAALACLGLNSAPAAEPPAREDVLLLRSVPEGLAPPGDFCDAARTGFAFTPGRSGDFLLSFWSVLTRGVDGLVLDPAVRRVGELRLCLSLSADPVVYDAYMKAQVNGLAFEARGVCRALEADVPVKGIGTAQCMFKLSGLPAPYVGGLLSSNTVRSQAPRGPETEPAGYSQASFATLRLWKTPP